MTLVNLSLVAVAIVTMWIGTRRQRRALIADTERQIRAGAHASSLAIGVEGLGDLPPPVARYLRLALPLRKAIPQVRLTQTGTLRTDATADRWMAFEAEHLVVPLATGFLWNARVRVAPLLHVRVRDALIDYSQLNRCPVTISTITTALTTRPRRASGHPAAVKRTDAPIAL